MVHSGRQLALFSNGNGANGRVMEVTPLAIREMAEIHPLPEPEPAGLETSRTLRERRAELGREIRRLVTLWHHRSGREFGAIYAEFNQRQRVHSQAKCTVDQLEQRVFWLEDRLR